MRDSTRRALLASGAASMTGFAFFVAGCSVGGLPPDEGQRHGVLVTGLVMQELRPGAEGSAVTIRAERALLTDLPGRGVGRLEGVEVRAPRAGGGGEVLATAPAADLSAEGSVTLREAHVTSSGPVELDLHAETARIRPDGSLHAEGVRATIEVPE